MRPVSMGKLVEVLQNKSATQTPTANTGGHWQPSASRVEQAVNYFFEKLEAFSPGRFKTMYGKDDGLNRAKAEWATVIGRLTRTDIDAGFAKAKIKAYENDPRYQWPDVSTFIGLCRIEPSDLGLPGVEEAYQEACNKSHSPSGHQWSHVAVREAGRLTGWYEMQGHSDDPKKTRELFLYNYQVLMDRVVKGEDITPPITRALSDQSKISPLDAAMRNSQTQLKASMENLGINPNGGRAEFLKYLNTL